MKEGEQDLDTGVDRPEGAVRVAKWAQGAGKDAHNRGQAI